MRLSYISARAADIERLDLGQKIHFQGMLCGYAVRAVIQDTMLRRVLHT